ncbi:MAG: phosphoribosylformylglycinamidine synthase subunit PurS [Dehalococcoidia bacterium]|jgi:phosphoribosylformylglycinamidine synthase|nr:phosphoribosylformylglycinamidine synthase subunit PurS [Dehalococcoidia bacterium]
MPRFLAHVNVMLRPIINDPQGLAVRDGLHSLGFAAVTEVRVGKRIDVTLEAATPAEAEAQVRDAAKQLLANSVIEDFEVTVTELATA